MTHREWIGIVKNLGRLDYEIYENEHLRHRLRKASHDIERLREQNERLGHQLLAMERAKDEILKHAVRIAQCSPVAPFVVSVQP